MQINDFLIEMVKRQSSDMYLKVGSTPILRVDGRLTYMEKDDGDFYDRVSPTEISELAFSIMTEEQKEKFEKQFELDLSYSASGIGRFRANVFYQRNSIALVFRRIPFDIPSFEELYLPQIVKDLANIPR